MKFTCFHLMPYAAMDMTERDKYPTAWMKFPNSNYNREDGRALYERYIGELVRAEELGFDGVGVNEHHQTTYGMMPSPIVIASILARETKNCRIAILGSAIPLRDHPLTLAEEHAMIDTISGGRLISGFVRGIGAEYHVFGSNPANSHERFHEAHDLIVQAWTRDGPFAFEGKHYHFQYVNPWPRPYQQPHPPIWIPSQGSKETIEWAAHPDRKYTYLHTFSPLPATKRFIELYRETAAGYGYTAEDDKLGWAVPIYVAETDEIARAEAKEHIEVFRNKFLKLPMEMLLPPGYLSLASMQRVMGAKAHLEAEAKIEILIDAGMFLCGSPETVRQQLSEYRKEIGFGQLLTLLQFGTLPADLTARNMDLFAAEVMAPLRAEIATADAAQ
ncbi:MAG: LLM class flavin-dependent oxidoreductase [Alphaproteobacteria bacterium]|nr:LLM class flavin-dependent oxidoreductase [Alphaproteobacteria bacterium]